MDRHPSALCRSRGQGLKQIGDLCLVISNTPNRKSQVVIRKSTTCSLREEKDDDRNLAVSHCCRAADSLCHGAHFWFSELHAAHAGGRGRARCHEQRALSSEEPQLQLRKLL